tara:strand:- start:361 stop:705 length:345 start_codon:yes stop_codon:yes gene_type:complete
MARHTVGTELQSIVRDMGRAHKLLEELFGLLEGFENLKETDFDPAGYEYNDEERASIGALYIVWEKLGQHIPQDRVLGWSCREDLEGISKKIEGLKGATVAISWAARGHIIDNH